MNLPYHIDLHGFINSKVVIFYHGFLYDEFELQSQVVEWLETTCEGKWEYDSLNGYTISFEKESDAMLYKLSWCG